MNKASHASDPIRTMAINGCLWWQWTISDINHRIGNDHNGSTMGLPNHWWLMDHIFWKPWQFMVTFLSVMERKTMIYHNWVEVLNDLTEVKSLFWFIFSEHFIFMSAKCIPFSHSLCIEYRNVLRNFIVVNSSFWFVFCEHFINSWQLKWSYSTHIMCIDGRNVSFV